MNTNVKVCRSINKAVGKASGGDEARRAYRSFNEMRY